MLSGVRPSGLSNYRWRPSGRQCGVARCCEALKYLAGGLRPEVRLRGPDRRFASARPRSEKKAPPWSCLSDLAAGKTRSETLPGGKTMRLLMLAPVLGLALMSAGCREAP